jgi:hypothetical protein
MHVGRPACRCACQMPRGLSDRTHGGRAHATGRRYIEVARAAMWSLARIASARWGSASGAVWPSMQAQALHLALEMIRSCPLRVRGPCVFSCPRFSPSRSS